MAETRDRLTALLFVAGEPVGALALAQALGLTTAEVETSLDALAASLQPGPLLLTRHQGTYRLVTAPEHSADVRAYLRQEARTELTRPALETLAIIAYRGPLTKQAVDSVRGVASDTMLRNLLARDLIVEHGPAPEPGRPMSYAVSHTFLKQLGLADLSELPPLPEANDEA